MSTLDDKILGEKTHYYCSSSEDEANDGDEDGNEDNRHRPVGHNQTNSNEPPVDDNRHHNRWDGNSCNTGPKGVIKDWQQYKQYESERRESDEREKLELIKKLSITCSSHLDDELAKKEGLLTTDDEDNEFFNEMNDPFLKEYMLKRMREMMNQMDTDGKDRPVFGKLLPLSSGAEFLEAIDKESKGVTIICHIYTIGIQECIEMNSCLDSLAKQYLNVKFCAIEASIAGMSRHFSKSGVPALLVYKSGNLLANFVRLGDEFTDRFQAEDVERFLVEHGVLNETLIPNIITNNRTTIKDNALADDEDDSD